MSGRSNQPGLRTASGQLAALAGRLSDRDRQLCQLLDDHQVLTSGQLARLLATPPRTLQQRLTQLTALQVVDRFRPHTRLGAGSAHYHYLLGETGARVLAADAGTSLEGLGWQRDRLLTLAHATGALTQLLGVNGLLAALTHASHTRPGCRLVCWWPARRCQARWGPLIAPDAYVRWQDPAGEVDFFLHHHPDQPELDQEQLIGLLAGYHDLAIASRITTPVLWWLPRPDREIGLRRRLATQPLLIPVATASPSWGHPADPVWLPTSSLDGSRRSRLGALGRAETWQAAGIRTDMAAASPPTPIRPAGRLEGLSVSR
jgi:hypothetical protein